MASPPEPLLGLTDVESNFIPLFTAESVKAPVISTLANEGESVVATACPIAILPDDIVTPVPPEK